MLWGASYLVNTKFMAPETAAGWVPVLSGLTGGRMLSGFASMKLSSETLIRIGTLLVLGGLIIMALPVPTLLATSALVLVGIGLAPIFPSMLHLTPVYFEREIAQAAMGMQMAFAYTGTTLMPPLFGRLFAVTSFRLMPYILLFWRWACGLHYPARGTRGEEPPSCRGSHLLGPEIAIEHSLDRLPACNHALVGNKIAGVMQFVNGTRLACPKEEQRSWNLLEEIGHILPNKAA